MTTTGPRAAEDPVDPGDATGLEQRRRRVVEAAVEVLAQDGPHGLSLRRIAALAGGSTQLIYTLFGGKPGLADALYREGFDRLATSMSDALAAAPPPGDPERLLALGRGYRRFALTEPAFFSVMFGRAIPGFTPGRSTRAAGKAATLGQVVTAAEQCLAAGTLVARDAAELASTCWVTAHGVSALEVASLLTVEDPDAFAEVVLRAPIEAHRPG